MLTLRTKCNDAARRRPVLAPHLLCAPLLTNAIYYALASAASLCVYRLALAWLSMTWSARVCFFAATVHNAAMLNAAAPSDQRLLQRRYWALILLVLVFLVDLVDQQQKVPIGLSACQHRAGAAIQLEGSCLPPPKAAPLQPPMMS